MRKDIRDKWAEKLESGRYHQARGALRVGLAYCCLGVLCEVYREETGDGRWVRKEHGGFQFVTEGARDSRTLPVTVCDWAGLEECNPRLGDDPEGYAAHLNDNGSSFQEIAALVRQLPSGDAQPGL